MPAAASSPKAATSISSPPAPSTTRAASSPRPTTRAPAPACANVDGTVQALNGNLGIGFDRFARQHPRRCRRQKAAMLQTGSLLNAAEHNLGLTATGAIDNGAYFTAASNAVHVAGRIAFQRKRPRAGCGRRSRDPPSPTNSQRRWNALRRQCHLDPGRSVGNAGGSIVAHGGNEPQWAPSITPDGLILRGGEWLDAARRVASQHLRHVQR